MVRFKSVFQYLTLLLAILIYGIMGTINNQASVFAVNSFVILLILSLLSFWLYLDQRQKARGADPGDARGRALFTSRLIGSPVVLFIPPAIEGVLLLMVQTSFADACVPDLPVWMNVLSTLAAGLAGWQYMLLGRREK